MPSKRTASKSFPSRSDSDQDTHHGQRKRAARGPSAPKVPPPVYAAKVTSLAEQTASNPVTPAAEGVAQHIIERIKKCLDRGKHPNTPESEAKAAMLIASRLMAQHNLRGQSTVSIQRADGDFTKVIKMYAYQKDVGRAMTVFFDCKYYTRRIKHAGGKPKRLEFTFYGLADNTMAAAMAFEMCMNLIERWCMQHNGANRKSYQQGVADELQAMARRDAADEARKAREAELAAREIQLKEEEAEKEGRLKRFAPSFYHHGTGAQPVHVDSDEEEDKFKVKTERIPGGYNGAADDGDNARETSQRAFDDWVDGNFAGNNHYSSDDHGGSDSDDGHDNEDLKADFDDGEGRTFIDLTLDLDDEIRNLVKQQQETVDKKHTAIKSEDSKSAGPSHEIDRRWESHMQLVQFRDMAQTIADNYRKKSGTRRKSKSHTRMRNRTNEDAYQQGKADGRKIDVKRKRIEG